MIGLEVSQVRKSGPGAPSFGLFTHWELGHPPYLTVIARHPEAVAEALAS